MTAIEEYREALTGLAMARANDWLPNPSPLHRRNLDRHIAAANGNVNLAAANVMEECASSLEEKGTPPEKPERLKAVAEELREAAVDLYNSELPYWLPHPPPLRVRQREHAIAVNRHRVEELMAQGMEIMAEETSSPE